MTQKISLLSALAVGAASLLTWGGFEAHKNKEYNKKMNEYGQRLKKFFEKHKNLDDLLMCKNKLEEECKGGKGYLPDPYNNKDWEEVYKNFKTKDSEYSNNEVLRNINNPEDLKDYCYGEVRKDLLEEQDFYPTGSTFHYLCVLNPYPAKK